MGISQKKKNLPNRQKPRKLYPSGEEEESQKKKEKKENLGIVRTKNLYITRKRNQRRDIKEVGVSSFQIA